MKKYIAPELEVSKFEAADIVTTSSGEPETNTVLTALNSYKSTDLEWKNDPGTTY